MLYIKFFEFFNQLGLLIRIEVRVRVKRSFYILVTKPLSDKQRRKTELYKKAGVRVPKIMQTYSFYTGAFCTEFKMIAKKHFTARQETVGRLSVIHASNMFFKLHAKKIR